MSESVAVRPPGPGVRPCKVCGGDARSFGAADFNRSCEDAKGPVFPPSGVEIGYRRCELCELIFTEAFDDWSHADFQRRIYNDDYIRVDPEFVSIRPQGNARNIGEMFASSIGEIRLLDYGGGAGVFAAGMRERGYDATTYDPFSAEHSQRPAGRFNLITCFETVEHMPDPRGGAADVASFLDDEAVILFTTVVQPPDIAEAGIDWWYIGPRNGHVTLHSQTSLGRLWDDLGVSLISFGAANHVAFRVLPPFARRWLPRQVGGEV